MILCVRTQAERQTVRRDKYFCEAVSRDGALPALSRTFAEDFAAGLCFLSSLSLSADTDDSVSAGTGVDSGTLTTGVACAAGSCASGFGATCAVAVSSCLFLDDISLAFNSFVKYPYHKDGHGQK